MALVVILLVCNAPAAIAIIFRYIAVHSKISDLRIAHGHLGFQKNMVEDSFSVAINTLLLWSVRVVVVITSDFMLATKVVGLLSRNILVYA